MIKNPILRGFNPDPSIIRIGTDYYIATSTFEWWSGIEIYHSKDLKNWELFDTQLDDISFLDMKGIPDGGGVWAPCLTYCDGVIYLLYREAYFRPDKRNGAIIYSYSPLPDAEEQIFEKISDICISMKASDYLKMPDRVDNIVNVGMSDSEMKLYRELEKEMLLPFSDGDIDAVNAAVLSNKLLQLANGAVYNENGDVKKIHSRKLDALEDLIEAANGKPL